MKNPLYSPNAANLGLLLARVPLGAYFVIAGFNKIQGGVSAFVKQSSGAVPAFLPQAIGETYLYAVPFAEVVIGLLVVLGLFSRIAGLLMTLMLISFTIAVTGIVDSPKPFHANVVFIGIALMVFLTGSGSISLDRAIWKKGGVTPY